jgi:sugar lactone lactonase YvrE
MRAVCWLVASVLIAAAGAPAQAHPAPGIAVNGRGEVFFVDFRRNRIMKIGLDGKPSVFIDGSVGERFLVPHHLLIDRDGNLYTAGDRGGRVWRIAPDGAATQIYPPTDWYGITFVGSGGDPFAIDAERNIYCINARQDRFCQILRIAPEGMITNLAGGAIGAADGKGEAARFGELHASAFVCAADGTLFLTDGSKVRKIAKNGTVMTVAGSTEAGFADGRGSDARFGVAAGIAIDAGGNLWVADSGNGRIRRVSPEGSVSTLEIRDQPTIPVDAQRPNPLQRPVGVAVGPSGDVYVLDYPNQNDNPRVSRITRGGEITELARIE